MFGDVEGPVVASFSSRGPSSVNPKILKPDVIGPDVNIFVAWPLDLSLARLPWDQSLVKFNLILGISMSCPIATNTSANVFAIGAEHVNLEKEANAGLVYDLSLTDYNPYLCGLNYTTIQISVIVGTNVPCPTDPESTRPRSLNYLSFSVLFDIRAAPVTTAFKRMFTNIWVA
ncbi:hypothetical protein SUGI_1030040 [Cryptomeria japonica]|nr:hypothetical protein SUGI_1030040 [Cryptomeria japonica]